MNTENNPIFRPLSSDESERYFSKENLSMLFWVAVIGFVIWIFSN